MPPPRRPGLVARWKRPRRSSRQAAQADRLRKLSITESFNLREERDGIVTFYQRTLPDYNFVAKQAWPTLALTAGETFTIVGVTETGMHSQIVGQDGKRGRELPLLQLTQLDEAIEKGILDVVLKD